MPYRLFENDNERARDMALQRYLAGINRHLDEPIEECLSLRMPTANPVSKA